MFKKRFIIGATHTELVFAKVSTTGGGKILKSKVEKYNVATVREVLEMAKKEFGFKKVRLLLAEDLSYFLTVLAPKELKGASQRRYVEEVIGSKIPEKLSDLDWDYKDLGIEKTLDKAKLIVFAPVKGVYGRILEVLRTMDVEVEAVEPEEIATKRNKNPLIGLAMKKDLVGKDSEVLNIVGKSLTGIQEASVSKKKPLAKTFISLFILFSLMLALVGFYILRLNNRETPLIEGESFQGKVVIFVGEDDLAVANDIKDILFYEGFGDVDVEIDAYEVDETIYVKVKPGVPVDIYADMERALNSDYFTVLEAEELDVNSNYDVGLFVGQLVD